MAVWKRLTFLPRIAICFALVQIKFVFVAIAFCCAMSAAWAQGEQSVKNIDPLLKNLPLENERVGPVRVEDIPALSPVPGTVDQLLYNDRSKSAQIFHFRIPDQYLQGSSGRRVETIGILVLVHYPTMKGLIDVNNRKLLNCIKDCEGQILLRIYSGFGNRMSDAQGGAAVLLRKMSTTGGFGSATYETLRKEPFEEIYNVRFTSGRRAGDQERYYVKRSQDGSIDRFASCILTAAMPLCRSFGVSSEVRGVEIQYGFPLTKITEWDAIHSALLELVRGFYVRTYFTHSN